MIGNLGLRFYLVYGIYWDIAFARDRNINNFLENKSSVYKCKGTFHFSLFNFLMLLAGGTLSKVCLKSEIYHIWTTTLHHSQELKKK